jgi:Flp pilus assembly protein TadG
MIEAGTRGHSRRMRKGATAVEFAITAPVFFMLLCGALEFSRVNMIRHTIHNAAYEGARRGIVPGASADDVRSTTASVLRTVGTSGAVVTVTPSVIEHDTPQVTVDVQVSVGQNGWIAPVFFQGSSLAHSCTLAREEYQTVSVP